MAKMFLGETPIQSLNVHHFEMNTNDATVVSSDLQAGVTCYARGQKVTGTGKSFEFAQYGNVETNLPLIIPSAINIVEIASTVYPIKSTIVLNDMKNIDFSTPQTIGNIIVDNVEFPVVAMVDNGMFTLSCDQTTTLQVFYGKDNYV